MSLTTYKVLKTPSELRLQHTKTDDVMPQRRINILRKVEIDLSIAKR